MNPKVSVVIPCYNYGKYLEDAVTSVLRSYYKNIEIIIVDDGSTDPQTEAILQAYEKLQNNVIQVVRRDNGGLSAARNTGITRAAGEYIVTLDADDLIHPAFIEKSVWVLERNETIQFTYPLVQLFGEQNHVWETLPYSFFYLKFRNYIPATIVMRKQMWEKLGGYDERMREGYEDWDFLIRAGTQGYVGYHLNEILFYYRKHAGSMLEGSKKKHSKLRKYLVEKHSDIYQYIWLQILMFCFIEARRRAKKELLEIMKRGIVALPIVGRERLKSFAYRLKSPFEAVVPAPEMPAPSFRQPMSTQKRNIVIVLPWLQIGGVERVFHHIVSNLNEKFRFTLITTKESRSQPLEGSFQKLGINVYQLDSFVNEADKLAFLEHIILSVGADIVHFSNSAFMYRCTPYLKERYPALTLIDTLHMEEPWSAWDFFALNDRYYPYIDITTVLTDKQRRRIIQGRKKVVVIGNGVPTDHNTVRSRTNEFPIVGFIGRYTEQKQPFVFLETARLCIAKGMKLRFRLYGSGELESAMRSWVKRKRLERYIEFMGTTDDIYTVMNEISILCAPSLKEGLPLVGLEAMQTGLPIIASDTDGWNDIIVDGHNGLLCERKPEAFVEAISRLLSSIELYESISKHAATFVQENYSVERMVTEYSRLYDQPSPPAEGAYDD